MFEKKFWHNKRIFILLVTTLVLCFVLTVHLVIVMIFRAQYYSDMATDVHQRERNIKAARGMIVDRNGVILASNETVCNISVIHSQITEPERVIEILSSELGISEEAVRKRVEKFSSIEKIKSNVDKETGDRIRDYGLAGVKVDEDYKRYYPYGNLASKVLGFTGADNQGIVGLEVKYDANLAGTNGKILTITDAHGVEIEGKEENRKEPVAGMNLVTTIDYNIQTYAQQLAEKAMIEKEAKQVCIIVMNPKNGEILAMVNTPEYDLNAPYVLNYETDISTGTKEYQDALNKMWRNFCINDTYEPGSTFKMVVSTAALETGVVSLSSSFTCSGSTIVEDRRIRCHKTTGHGTQTFTQTVMNSCNPAFIEWGRRVGVDNFYKYVGKLGLLDKTGVDLPGEASTIIHKKENVGPVELATMSFGQSFQITPLALLRAASAIVNGGTLVTPHFAIRSENSDQSQVIEYEYETIPDSIDKETSDTMSQVLYQVVNEGGGHLAKVEGFTIGGKTATSQKLPRGNGKYFASFIGFAPVEDPQLIAMCIIDEPTGVYYGGTIAAPVIGQLFENILPNYIDKQVEK